MSDESALLAAIWEHPHEDTPRLMYADWLQETGSAANVARAEFIRLQCEIAKLDWRDPARAEPEVRAAILQKKHGGKWKGNLPKRLRSVRYSRGFAQPSRTLRASDITAIPDSEWNAVPLWNISLAKHDAETLNALAASPHLLRVGNLPLNPGRRGKLLDGAGAIALVQSPHARNLAVLDFTSTRIPVLLLEAIFASPALENLRDLSFCCCGLPDKLIRLLVESSVPERLTRLDLQGNVVTWTGLRQFFENAGRFVRLASLGIPLMQLPEALDLTLCSPFPSLRGLHASTNWAIPLARWPGVATLQRLSLHGGVWMGLAEAKALAESPFLTQLRNLSCAFDQRIREEAVKLLKARFGEAVYG